MNENTEYEKLVQELYQEIINSEGHSAINVQHNIEVEGKSGCKHQIDVYWEFQIAGETHKVAIECKNYSNTVEVGNVRDFFGVLHDIGNIKGIMVTKKGFQSGAKKFAEYYGITLKEVRRPEGSDWDDRVKTIVTRFKPFMTNVKERKIQVDEKWFKENMPKSEQKTSFGGNPAEMIITDSEGKKITDMMEIERSLPNDMKELKDQIYHAKFEEAFLNLPNGIKIKILQIDYLYDIIAGKEETFTIEGESLAKAIIKDVKSGDITFIRKSEKYNFK